MQVELDVNSIYYFVIMVIDAQFTNALKNRGSVYVGKNYLLFEFRSYIMKKNLLIDIVFTII